MDCKYCKVKMYTAHTKFTSTNRWLCSLCEHREVNNGSYALEGYPSIDACDCKNCKQSIQNLTMLAFNHPSFFGAEIISRLS